MKTQLDTVKKAATCRPVCLPVLAAALLGALVLLCTGCGKTGTANSIPSGASQVEQEAAWGSIESAGSVPVQADNPNKAQLDEIAARMNELSSQYSREISANQTAHGDMLAILETRQAEYDRQLGIYNDAKARADAMRASWDATPAEGLDALYDAIMAENAIMTEAVKAMQAASGAMNAAINNYNVIAETFEAAKNELSDEYNRLRDEFYSLS